MYYRRLAYNGRKKSSRFVQCAILYVNIGNIIEIIYNIIIIEGWTNHALRSLYSIIILVSKNIVLNTYWVNVV